MLKTGGFFLLRTLRYSYKALVSYYDSQDTAYLFKKIFFLWRYVKYHTILLDDMIKVLAEHQNYEVVNMLQKLSYKIIQDPFKNFSVFLHQFF